MLSHTGVGVCLKLGKIWFLENHNLIALERLARYSFTQSTSMLWKDKGFPLPTSRLHGIFTWYWLIIPCPTFDAILLFFLFLRTGTATLLDDCYWICNTLSTTQVQEREVPFTKASILQLQSHHFLPCKCYMFSCYTPHSLHCSHFNPEGQKLQWIYNPANKTPQEADNLCKITTLVVSEREKGDSTKFRLCVGTNQLAMTYLWLESESLRSLFQNFHCFTVGNSARGRKKSLR